MRAVALALLPPLVVFAGCDRKSDPTPLAQKALSFVSGAVFEGEVTADVEGTATGGTRSTVFSFKGDKLRYDLTATQPAVAGWVLVDTTARKAYMINDAQKMYMTVDTDATSAAAGASATTPRKPWSSGIDAAQSARWPPAE